jgi:hypothetical protein
MPRTSVTRDDREGVGGSRVSAQRGSEEAQETADTSGARRTPLRSSGELELRTRDVWWVSWLASSSSSSLMSQRAREPQRATDSSGHERRVERTRGQPSAPSRMCRRDRVGPRRLYVRSNSVLLTCTLFPPRPLSLWRMNPVVGMKSRDARPQSSTASSGGRRGTRSLLADEIRRLLRGSNFNGRHCSWWHSSQRICTDNPAGWLPEFWV